MRANAIIFVLLTIEALAVITVDECVDVSASCVDKSHLCDIRAYDDLMNFYCKKTCNRDCTPFTTTTTVKPCADLTPDCVNKRALCTMTAFSDLTTQYCAKTCGRCI